jgi:Icc-related predicted phosphoesterase
VALFKRNRAAKAREGVTLFFATDLHGSETCFRKFVNAAAFYGADVLVLGGDLTGKLVVPLVQSPDGTWRARLQGKVQAVHPDGLEEFERRVRTTGNYPVRLREDELDRYTDDPEAVEGLFTELMHATLIRWMDHARRKLEGSGVRILTAPGNDDPFSIDDVIREHGGEHFQLLEGEIVEVAPGHEMLNTGYTNVTPWNTHREYSEEQIAAHLKEMTARLEHPERAIFNIHVPPYNSALDTAPALGDDLAVQTSMGAQMTAPVGSTAVRQALEEHQPLLSLHGHIHESGGRTRIGRTVAINAGSEYGEGVLRGLLVTVGGGRVLRHQATTG